MGRETIDGEQPFLTVNADIYCEIDFSTLLPVLRHMQVNPDEDLAHLVLVDNPGPSSRRAILSLIPAEWPFQGKIALLSAESASISRSFSRTLCRVQRQSWRLCCDRQLQQKKLAANIIEESGWTWARPERLRLLDFRLNAATANIAHLR